MTSVPGDSLTISELTRLTGVPSPTLRSWESRYGFPRPRRLPGGHRRYARSDVDEARQRQHVDPAHRQASPGVHLRAVGQDVPR